MQMPRTEPHQLSNDVDDPAVDESEEEADAPPAPDEEPDGEPDPAFD
jgi:hypothetical protein